jgi:hypothetical protein
MHPTTALFLANDRIAKLSREAARERLARTARSNHRPAWTSNRLLDVLARRQPGPSEELAC